jgi:signal transduction histidine kinase
VPATGSDRPRRRRWRPRWTLRLRLTTLYGSLFLVAGVILVGITYALMANSSSTGVTQAKQFVSVAARGKGATPIPNLPSVAAASDPGKSSRQAGGGPIFLSRTPQGAVVQFRQYAGRVNQTFRASAQKLRVVTLRAKQALDRQRSDQLDSLLTQSGIALGVTAILSIGLGWLMAGRALRPVRTMSVRARGISERNLHERLALDGPNDELKELGDTFDELLGRLETAFESQRRFVANASHELRTPITLERTLVELADPDASVESLRETCRRVLAAGVQQERLIEALLTLARSQRGLDSREQVDLAEVVADILAAIEPSGLHLERSLDAAVAAGDHRLLERLVANLLDNASKYNLQGGWVRVLTGLRDGMPTLEVVNSGPVIAPDRVRELREPFRRLDVDRTSSEPVGSRGLGLGLSIVDAIAAAHGARMTAAPRIEGGLSVEIRFPAVSGSSNGSDPVGLRTASTL